MLSAILLCSLSFNVTDAQPPVDWFDHNEAFVKRFQQGEYEKAIAHAKKALGVAKDSPTVAESLRNLAELYVIQRDYHRAETFLTEALEIRQKAGENSPDVAATLSNLGFLHYQQGNYVKAGTLYDQSWSIWKPIVESKPKWSKPLNFVPFLNNLALYKPKQKLTSIDFSVFLNNLALLHQSRGRYEEAEALYNRSRSIWETVLLEAKHPCVAAIQDNQAELYEVQGRYSEAESFYNKALAIWESLGTDGPDMTLAMQHLAFFYKVRDKYVLNHPHADSRSEKPILSETRFSANLPDAAKKLENLARIASKQGKYAEAERHYRRLLRTLAPERIDAARAQNNLGSLFYKQGRYSEAEFLYKQSLATLKIALGENDPDVASIQNNLAVLYEVQGKYSDAEALYAESLKIWEAALGANHPDVASAQNNLGILYCRQGKYPEAELLLQSALRTLEAALGANHPDVADVLDSLAELYYKQAKYSEAEPFYKRSLAIFEAEFGQDHPDVANALKNLSALYRAQGKHDQAKSTIDRAIRIFDNTTGYPQSRVSAYALQAKLFKQKGDSDGAFRALEEALRSTEELRPQIGGGEQTRAGFFEKYADLFDLMTEWQLEDGKIEKAIEYAERGRARVLLDQLAVGKIDLRRNIPEDIRQPLEKREMKAKSKLAEYQQRITLTRSRKDLSDADRLTRITELEEGLRTAYREYQQVYEDIKNASPLWRDLITTGGKPVSLRTIQRQLIPMDGLMLIYQIGKVQSNIFVIPPKGQNPEAIPLIVNDRIAKQLKVDAGPLTSALLQQILSGRLDTTSRNRGGGTSSESEVTSLLPSRGLKRRKAAYATSPEARLHALWQLLVPNGLWETLVESSEVILIPDSALHQLPFEMLVVHLEETATRYWLDEGPVIRYAPSSTTLYNIEKRPPSRITPNINQPLVLSLANPIYDPVKVIQRLKSQPTSRWERVRKKSTNLGSQVKKRSMNLWKQTVDLRGKIPFVRTRDSYERAGGLLIELPGTALETEEIRKAFASSGVLPLTELKATEPQLRENVSGKRYVHLATHGLVDERGRSLFSALALTPPPGEATTTEDDGFLQLYEIYELNLSECELAVLSACQSNVGTNFEGEGVFALSRGFLAAGSRRVIGSQWSVDDASTAELIGNFFRKIAAMEKAGERIDIAQALRDAKRHVRSQGQWSVPYYWAPFILTGKR